MRCLVLFMLLGLCIESNGQVRNTVIWGTVYNIFHDEYGSDEEVFRQVDNDVAAMKNASLNHVMIFPMSQWDPATRQPRWTRTDDLVRKIEDAGLRFVPIWMYDKISGFRQKYEHRNCSSNNRENVDIAYSTSPGAGLAELIGASRKDWIRKKGTFRVSTHPRSCS